MNYCLKMNTTPVFEKYGTLEDKSCILNIVFVTGGIMSYSSPIASEAAQGLYDSSYDGTESNGVLSNGLGRLVDGEVGLDNFRLDIGYGKGKLFKNYYISFK